MCLVHLGRIQSTAVAFQDLTVRVYTKLTLAISHLKCKYLYLKQS